MPRLRQICEQNEVLLIADEVMSGWCRTGKWFAMDHWGVVPDILTTAKGITNAAIPLGLCATTGKIAAYFDDHFFSHGHTYEAHPLTLAPAVASIKEMKRLNLTARAVEMGAYVGKKLNALKERHPSIGDVRGIGMFWAVELVRNQKAKTPFNTFTDKISGAPLVVDKVAAKMMGNGVYIQAWMSHFVIAPPLIVTEKELDQGVAALDEALGIADAEIER
jgi:taurine---2-oxoglutarate transaminase